METSSRPRRRSPGETDRQPLLVTDSWSVENITQGARAVSTPGSKEAGPRKGGSKQFSANRKPRQGGSTRKRHSLGSGRGADTRFKFSPYSPMMFGSSSPKPRRASAPSPRRSRAWAIESSPEEKMEEDEIDGPPLEQCLVLPEEEDLESLREALVSSSKAMSRPESEGRDPAVSQRAVDIDDERAIISSYNYDTIVKKAMSVTQAAGESTGSVEATARGDHIDTIDCDIPVILDTSDVAVANDAGQGGDSGGPITKAESSYLGVNADKAMDHKRGQAIVHSTVEDDDIALKGVEESSIGEATAAGTSGDLELDDMVEARRLGAHDTCEAIQEVVGMDSGAEVSVAETFASMEEILPVLTREAGVGDGSTMVKDDESDVMMVVGTHSERKPTVKSAGDTLEWPGPSLIILEEDTEDVGVSVEGTLEIERERSGAPSEGRAEEYGSGWLKKRNGVHCISCTTDDAADFARIGPVDDDVEAISTVEEASTPLSKGLPVVTDIEVQAEEQMLPEVGDVKPSGVEERAAVYRGQGLVDEDGQEKEAKNEVQVEARELQAEEKEDSHKLGDAEGDQCLTRKGHLREQPRADSALAQGTDGYNGNAEFEGTKMVVEADDDAMPVITEETSAVAAGNEAAQFIGGGETDGDVEHELPGERIMDWGAVALEMEEEWVLGGLNEASTVDPPGVPGLDVRGQSEADVSSHHVSCNPVLDDFNLSGFDCAGTAGTEVQESAHRVEEEVKSAEFDGFALLPSAGDGSAAMDALPADPAAAETFGSTGGGPESVGAEIREDRKEVSDVSLPRDRVHYDKKGERSAYVMPSICPNERVHSAEGVSYEPGVQKSLNDDAVASPGVGTHSMSDRVSPVQRGASFQLVQSGGMTSDGRDTERSMMAEWEQSQSMNQGRESEPHGHVDGSCECCVVM